jgi:hypothetical protein
MTGRKALTPISFLNMLSYTFVIRKVSALNSEKFHRSSGSDLGHLI